MGRFPSICEVIAVWEGVGMVHLGSFVCRPEGTAAMVPVGGWGGEVIALICGLICESHCIHVYQENETLICDYGCNEKDCGRAIASSEDLENVDSLIAWQGLVSVIRRSARLLLSPALPPDRSFTCPLNHCHRHCFRFLSLSL